jgi:hypothetical protein
MKYQSNKNQNRNGGQRAGNVVEAFKDLGSSTVNSLKQDLVSKMPQDLMEQLFGEQSVNRSGELYPGTSTELGNTSKPGYENELILQTQLITERKIFQEEKNLIEKRTNELRMQLKVLTDEVVLLAKSTQNLSQEVTIAANQIAAEPGVYHVFFFERIIEFIRSFRNKIEDTTLWMGSANKRAEKKNYWSKYKKHGGKFLLSADHYLSRSAG